MKTLRTRQQTYQTALGGTAAFLLGIGILADIAPLSRALSASADDSESSGAVMERAVTATHEQYLRNKYLSDLRLKGYRGTYVPKGWPSGLNLDRLLSKLTTTCP